MDEGFIEPSLIRQQLSALSDSPQFRSAGRLREFLNFVVLETLAGREQSIKEYTIGTAVYGRGSSFNPKLDSIVRVDAVKLRARLNEYYGQQRSPKEIIIYIPKGRYIPEFRNHAASEDQVRSCAGRVSELCDLGSYSLLRRTPAAIEAALRWFTLARNLNPGEARSYIGLADAYVASLDIEAAPPSGVLAELKSSVMEGLRLNNASADAHVFASIYSATSNGTETTTMREARRALELQPHSAMGHFWAAGLLSARGVHEAGIEHMREASRNAPYCTLFRAYLGRVLYYAARNQEALTVLTEVTSADPTLAVAHMWIALVHSELGRHDQAIHAGLHAVEISETSATLSGAAYALARAGLQEDAESIFERLTKTPPYGYVPPLQLAVVAEALKRRDESAAYLAHAQRENSWGLIWHRVDPRVARIRSKG